MTSETPVREATDTEHVRLRAEDVEDLAVIAALLQDARAPLRETAYDPKERRFMAAFTRFRRELPHDPATCAGLTECPSALIFDCIDAVRHRGLEQISMDDPLTLLTIATEPGDKRLFNIDLLFDEGCEIRLASDCIDCRIEDFGEAVPAARTPCDHFAETAEGDASPTRTGAAGEPERHT